MHLARYLVYETSAPTATGINHQVRNLKCLMAEAHRSGRTAVLPSLNLSSHHNFGFAGSWRWDTYFDLSASRLVEADGRRLPLPLSRSPVSAGLQVERLALGAPMPRTNRDVVIRRIAASVWPADVPGDWRVPAFDLRPSALVMALAEPVAGELAARGGGAFAAAHVRRGDLRYGPLLWYTSPGRIQYMLRQLGVADGAPVFFLSDEHAPRFWRAVGRHVGVVRYVDFPRLRALVSGDAPPDNYLLYEVEKAVMRCATICLGTFDRPYYDVAVDAFLVPQSAKKSARMMRLAVKAAANGLRRSLHLVLGDRGLRAARSVRSALRSGRKPDGPPRRSL